MGKAAEALHDLLVAQDIGELVFRNRAMLGRACLHPGAEQGDRARLVFGSLAVLDGGYDGAADSSQGMGASLG